MTLLDRWQLAFQSPLGLLLISLILCLALLLMIYWVLKFQQKKGDYLKYLYQNFYEKAERELTGFSFLGAPRADFFGRRSLVKNSEGVYAICLIPTPELALPAVREKFQEVFQYIDQLAGFAHYFKGAEKNLFLIQSDTVNQNGTSLSNISHYLLDQTFSLDEKEKIVLFIAKCLSNLHQRNTRSGEKIYHGFLLPRSLFLELDIHQRIQKVILADLGWAFSLGPEGIFQRVESLRCGKLPVEKYCAQEVLEEMHFLAPEQRDSARLKEVGPSVDFFALGALAIYIFTGKKLIVEEIDWSSIPVKWRPFLKSCLSPLPHQRPKDFLEMEDWMSDPELALTSSEEMKSSLFEEEKSERKNAKELLNRINQTKQKPQLNPELKDLLDLGIKAIRLGKWEDAKKQFKEIVKQHPEDPQAHVFFAITCYELEDFKNAEKHYELAKKISPSMAKAFREHIAFKV